MGRPHLSRTSVREVACPNVDCEAPVGEPCRGRAGLDRASNHRERYELAQRTLADDAPYLRQLLAEGGALEPGVYVLRSTVVVRPR